MPDLLFDLQFLEFQAARQLARAPAHLPEARLHGHGFRLAVRHAGVAAPAPAGQDRPDAAQVAAELCAGAVAALDHQLLDHLLADPTDARLVIHLASRLPAGSECALQSMPGRGVRRAATGALYAWRGWRFESAHRLPRVPPGHKCGRLHGHGFLAVVHVPVEDPDRPWHGDYARLDAAWAPLHARLHQRCLNDLPGLDNPTSEWLSVWIWQELADSLPDRAWVTVYETAGCGAHFDGGRHRIWKDFSIDSAALRGTQMLGHSWKLRLHLEGLLHPIFGWALDFAEVKREFEPLFRSLDHQPLHEVAGLTVPDSRGLACWIRQHAPLVLPALRRVDVFDGCGGGAVLDWGAAGLQILP